MVDTVPERIALVSYRLGMADGVSVAAAQWISALQDLGADVRTVAGAGTADVVLPGLAIDSPDVVAAADLAAALADVDLVIADNIASLPLNPRATDAVCDAMQGRRAVLRHHDFPWERERFRDVTGLPRTDPCWRHVTISENARRNLWRVRGIEAATVYHGVHLDVSGRRDELRALLEVGPTDRIVLQPTRAIARKRVDIGFDLARRLGSVYWLTGPAEENFDDDLSALPGAGEVKVVRGLPAGYSMADVYAASDLVTLPSDREGFGLPLIESALARRPMVVSNIPVTNELRALGFDWIELDDITRARRALTDPDPASLDRNEALAREHFGPGALRAALARLLGPLTRRKVSPANRQG